jgi:nitric oxide dioxygenase
MNVRKNLHATFEIAPEVRQLFPADLSGQKVKLIGMLATVVSNLHRLDAILPLADAMQQP